MNVIVKELLELYIRDLNQVKNEILFYTDQDLLWENNEFIKNSGGNLSLHIIGNLNHFLYHILGKGDYLRNRVYEFSEKNVPVETISYEIDSLIERLKLVFEKLQDNDLLKNFPIPRKGVEVSTHFMITHLLLHLNYHLGQLNYHRKLYNP